MRKSTPLLDENYATEVKTLSFQDFAAYNLTKKDLIDIQRLW